MTKYTHGHIGSRQDLHVTCSYTPESELACFIYITSINPMVQRSIEGQGLLLQASRPHGLIGSRQDLHVTCSYTPDSELACFIYITSINLMVQRSIEGQGLLLQASRSHGHIGSRQ